MATSTITNLSNVNELVEVQLDNVTNTSGSYSHATTVSGITPDHKVLTIECSNQAAFRAPVTISTGANSITLSCSDVVGSSTVKVGVIIAGSGFPIVSAEYGALSNRVGNLSDLTTSDKSSVVNSINSVNNKMTKLKDKIIFSFGIVGYGDSGAYAGTISIKGHNGLSVGNNSYRNTSSAQLTDLNGYCGLDMMMPNAASGGNVKLVCTGNHTLTVLPESTLPGVSIPSSIINSSITNPLTIQGWTGNGVIYIEVD